MNQEQLASRPQEARRLRNAPAEVVPDDVVGPPILPAAQERRAAASRAASAERVAQIDNARARLKGESSSRAEELAARRNGLHQQLRELRLEQRNADTWAARIFPAARQKLASLETSLAIVRGQIEDIDAEMESRLPPQAKSVSRAEVVASAREKIGEVLGASLADRKDSGANVPRKILLRKERDLLARELGSLSFWQFGRKREIAGKIREIDREMSGIVNAERGR